MEPDKNLRIAILQEIADNWKLEAKSEDNSRYFYSYYQVNSVLNGSKSYVIGRKGAGKTAISEHIKLLGKQSDIHSEKLSFKNFPFNELYLLSNNKYTQPNQYITIWKYLIYSFICRMMLKSENIKPEIKEMLNLTYDTNPVTNLPRIVADWTTKSLAIDNSFNQEKSNPLSWIERVSILEDIIMNNLDQAKYYIVFDELDEDYRAITLKKEFEPYNNLITSLFKAVQDIKSIFRYSDLKIYPVIFLRDDIYGLVKDADKNKWSDFSIELEWNTAKIKKLLAFRINKATGKDIDRYKSFNQAWNAIFHNDSVPMGDRQRRTMTGFDYITRSTQIRPRDYMRYIQVCAKETLENDWDYIHHRTIKKVDKQFSNYLKNEIIDEIHAVLPDIEDIFQIFSQIRKQSLSIKEFDKVFSEYVTANKIKETNSNFVLQTLYNFSIIGNKTRNGMDVFRYLNYSARLNLGERIVIHRGLYKSLQIF